MRRILAIVALVAVATLSCVSVAGAQQYPPTTEDEAVQGENISQEFGNDQGGAGAGAGAAADGAVAGAGAGAGGAGGGAPLAGTGSDVLPLVLLGAALVGAGTFWVVTSRAQRNRA